MPHIFSAGGIGRLPAITIVSALTVAVLGSCSTDSGTITPDMGDTTPPTLQIGTAGLPRDLLVHNGAAEGQRGRARHDRGDVVVGATAQDSQSGIKEVSLDGQSKVTCTSGRFAQRRRGDIRISNPYTGDTSKVPETQRAFFTVRFADLHHCPTGSTFLAFEVELRATAMNHAGLTATTPNAVVHHSGPDSLKVATLNLADPELRRMSATDRTAALTRYGRELIAQADIASVQELGDESFLPVIAQAAGLSHYTARPHQLDVAILSRYPLTDAADYSFEGGAIYAATALIDGVDHRIFALHWKHRPEPWVTDIHRLEAARLVRDLSAAETFAIAAGDLNVCATSIATNADECEGRDAPGVETATLGEAMADAFLKVPSARHCSNKRIDVVFVRGYDVSAYDGCQDSNPSDDPFVLVGLSAPPGGPYQGECK